MAVNATTGVDYEVDRFAIWRDSLQGYINFNAVWPRVDGGPIEGGNPDYKWYKRTEAAAPPTPDHRFTVETTWTKVDTVPTPAEGHPAGLYQQSHTETKLPLADLLAQIETKFQAELIKHFPQAANPAVLLEAADAITRKQDNATLTDAQLAVLATITTTGDVLAQMRARQAELNAAATADEDYDIDAGWPEVGA